jgi:hypothetical protein
MTNLQLRKEMGWVLKLSVYLFLSFQFYVFPEILILGNTLECSDLKNSDVILRPNHFIFSNLSHEPYLKN